MITVDAGLGTCVMMFFFGREVDLLYTKSQATCSHYVGQLDRAYLARFQTSQVLEALQYCQDV